MSARHLARTLLVGACVWLAAAPAPAQSQRAPVERAPQPIDEEPTSGPDDTVDVTPDDEGSEEPAVGTTGEPDDTSAPEDHAGEPVPLVEGRVDAGWAAPDAGTAAIADTAALDAGVAVPGRTPPMPIQTSSATDADLTAAWQRWRKAVVALDAPGEEAARAELVRLKEDLGVEDLEPFAAGFVRAAEAREKAKDPGTAVKLASAAVQLAPDFPFAHVALAQATFALTPTDVGAYFSEIQAALGTQLQDPRYLRPALVDLAAAALFAGMATAAAVVLMLFLRRVRYFLHDFHHLFPKTAARWQTAALALLLLALPLVLRLGLVPVLLVLLAAVALHLSAVERIVAAALVALLGVVPLVAETVVARTAFAGTIGEDVLELEHGGLAAPPAAARIAARVADGRAGYEELFALGRYELRRGQLDPSVEHFKLAAVKRSNDARLFTNLGNALMAKGDEDGAVELYKSATQADPSLAAGFYDVSRLYNRRAATVPDDQVSAELDKSRTALATAQKLDEALLFRKDPPEDHLLHNRLLVSPGLSRREIANLAFDPERGSKVAAQLALALTGTARDPWAYAYPGLLAALLAALGFLAPRLSASKECEKCGRSVCRRCDPELGMGSLMCHQCVNVFARKGVVPPTVKVRKQAEVDRYHGRMDRLSYVFGLLCSGAGHVFSGLPLRGALYAYAFLFLVFSAVFRTGVLRAPFGGMPGYLKLAPLAVAFLLLYLLSLRGLYKRQAD